MVAVYGGGGGDGFLRRRRCPQRRSPRGDYRRLSPDLLPPRFVTYHERLTKSSGTIHNVMRFRAEVEHDPAAAEAMAHKAAVVNEALAALRQGQRDRLGPIMDRDFDPRQSVCGPAPEQTRMIAIAREQGAPAKFTGSGSAAIQGCGGADARRACSRRGTFGLRGAVEFGIGQHSTELAVFLHYFCKLWIRLPEERSRTQDCLFRLDAAPIGCQVERFACEPVAGTAVRPVLSSLQGNPRRRVDQIKVEPSVLFWIEPGFSGSQHQRGVGGRRYSIMAASCSELAFCAS